MHVNLRADVFSHGRRFTLKKRKIADCTVQCEVVGDSYSEAGSFALTRYNRALSRSIEGYGGCYSCIHA